MFPKHIPLLLWILWPVDGDYLEEREKLIHKDQSFALGSSIRLNRKQKAANEILMNLKTKEFDEAFQAGDFFNYKHILKSRRIMEKSKVFKFITMMPKGASLHVHEEAMLSAGGVYNLIMKHSRHLYVCMVATFFKLEYFQNLNDTSCKWISLKKMKSNNPAFKTYLRKELIMHATHLGIHPDSHSFWRYFKRKVDQTKLFRNYLPVFSDYIYQTLKELYEDNVMYVEIRSQLNSVYDSNADDKKFRKIKEEQVMAVYADVIQRFKADHPDFIGARVIYSIDRQSNNENIENFVNTYVNLTPNYNNYLAGIDLLGPENLVPPLVYFLDELQLLAKRDTKFFFHAGQTNWGGTPEDTNLFDAILLNATRIGSAYSLIQHPQLLKMVKERNIALEMCPLASQVFRFVNDLGNHPAVYLLSSGFPVVIGSGYPGLWGAKGMSYDWYVTFMTMSPKNADLRLLMQLARNSIMYSAMNEEEKLEAEGAWNELFFDFVEKVHNTTF